MKIFVKAKPRSYEEKVERIDDVNYIVSVQEPPANGLANKGIAKALADYFGVSSSRVKILKGFSSRNKIFEII